MSITKILPNIDSSIHSAALSVFRISVGALMFFGHGLGKLTKIGTEAATQFPDPLGVGSQVSHLLAASAEGIGALCVMFGLFTRLSAFAQMFTMFVAAFVIHAGDPLFSKGGPSKEFALLYLLCFMIIFFLGAGKFSLDKMIFKK